MSIIKLVISIINNKYIKVNVFEINSKINKKVLILKMSIRITQIEDYEMILK